MSSLPPARPVLVWDLAQRLAHALLIACVAGAWLTAEWDGARLWHASFGLCAAGLLLWRGVWGLVGSRHARFAQFLRGPQAVAGHLLALVRGEARHEPGHNPAGGWAVVALLLLGVLAVASGWWSLSGGHAAEELHEALANGWLALIGLHVAAVLLTGWRLRVNLVRAMVDGRQPGAARDGLPRSGAVPAALLLAAVLAFWAWQWRQAPQGQAWAQAAVEAWQAAQGAHHGRGAHRDDDDD